MKHWWNRKISGLDALSIVAIVLVLELSWLAALAQRGRF